MSAGATNDDVVRLRGGIALPLAELVFQASRSGGPGGQNVNKVATRVTLRFDVRRSPSLGEAARQLLLERLAPRLTRAGELVIHAAEFRSLARNRAAAIARLVALLDQALLRPKPRQKTRPGRAAVERRIRERKHKSRIKRLRRKPGRDD